MQLIEVDPFAAGAIVVENSLPPGNGNATQCLPDAHWAAVAGFCPESRCSLWWRNTPMAGDQRVGVIGHYAGGGDDTAAALLEHACRELQARGCNLAVGPMDGNTWNDYRFVTDFGDEPRFWLEPSNPPEWPRQFVRNNFQPLSEYFSALNPRLDYRDRGLDKVDQRLHGAGVRMRPISEQSFDDDLRHIFGVARIAFRSNLLYSEPNESEFIKQSRPLQRFAPLELSWIAERHGRAVGFLFAVPDLLEEARLGRSNTAIIKTLAVVPARAYAGLGLSMLAQVQEHAFHLGYSRAIHAFMRDVGSMRRLSGRYARPMRRYTLFAKALTRTSHKDHHRDTENTEEFEECQNRPIQQTVNSLCNLGNPNSFT